MVQITDAELRRMGYLTKPRHDRVDGYVYCYVHGCIHDDTRDPYGSGDRCPKNEHRPVYVALRRGDGPVRES